MPNFNHVNNADYALIALYFGIVIFVGWYSSRKNRNTDDYFKGGGKIPWFLAGVSNWVSGFSAFMFVAAAGFTYRYGLGAAVILPRRRGLTSSAPFTSPRVGGGRASTHHSNFSPAVSRRRRLIFIR